MIGVHRIDRDLLCHRPDFVCAEFAVNDFNTMLTETYDSMVRKILLSPALPDVLADGYSAALPVFRFLATLG